MLNGGYTIRITRPAVVQIIWRSVTESVASKGTVTAIYTLYYAVGKVKNTTTLHQHQTAGATA
ncbi:MAG: hypothetical protein AAFY48_15645, partial [Bacteroidota bacterium]